MQITNHNSQMACLPLGSFEHMSNGGRQFAPGVFLDLELVSSGLRQLVVLRMPAVFSHGPFGLDPAAPLQAMQRRVERALFDAQHVFGNLLNALRNGPAVLRLKRQRLEDQQIECSLWKVDTAVGHKLPCYFYSGILLPPL